MIHEDIVVLPDEPGEERLDSSEWNKMHIIPMLDEDPSAPAVGAKIWMSSGVGTGDRGDILVIGTVDGVTKIFTLAPWSLIS